MLTPGDYPTGYDVKMGAASTSAPEGSALAVPLDLSGLSVGAAFTVVRLLSSGPRLSLAFAFGKAPTGRTLLDAAKRPLGTRFLTPPSPPRLCPDPPRRGTFAHTHSSYSTHAASRQPLLFRTIANAHCQNLGGVRGVPGRGGGAEGIAKGRSKGEPRRSP